MSQERILCVDPASGQFFSTLVEYNDDPGLVVYPDDSLPPPHKHSLLSAKSDALRAVRQLSNLDNRRWALDSNDSQVQAFRRRRLPDEMRVRTECTYPKYVADSSLSEAFQHKTVISLDINLEPFKEQIISEEMNHILNVVNQSISLEIKVQVELVTSAHSAIQTIVRKVLEKFKKPIECGPGLEFCLKVQGLEDYMYGNTLMMDFQHTRQIIRGYSSMELTLLQVDFTQNNPCPYLFKDTPHWPTLLDAPLFLWYAPYDLTTPLQSQQPTQQPSRLSIKDRESFHSLPLIQALSQQLEPSQLPHNKRIPQTQSVQAGPARVYSGDLEKPLQVELLTLSELNQIMGLCSQQAASLVDNGQQPPPYVTYNKKDAHLKQLMKSASQKKSWYSCIWGGASLSKCSVTVETRLYLGNRLLWQPVEKQRAYQGKQVVFGETLPLQGHLWQMPLETRLCFEISVGQNSLDRRIIGVCQTPLFDLHGKMLQGPLVLNLWPFCSLEPRISCMGQFRQVTSRPAAQLTICISHPLPVYWSLATGPMKNEIPSEVTIPRASLNRLFSLFQILLDKPAPEKMSPEEYQQSLKRPPSMDDIAQLDRILKTDHLSLEELSAQDKAVLFRCRDKYSSVSGYLIYLLKAVDFTRPDQVVQVYHLLEQWTPLDPGDALVLLDSWMADQRVRAYAVTRVALFPDEQLVLYMLQLVQALQFENMLHSPLAELLLARALASPFVVGHEFFWLLRSYLSIKPSFERYSLLLEQFLMCCGAFRATLYRQYIANNIIASISQQLSKNEPHQDSQQKQKGKERKLEAKTRLLQKLLKNKKGFPDEFALATDPRIVVTAIKHKECKLFSSKKMPLNLKLCTKTFLGQAGEMRTIFKTGDDLRMDMVAIQLIRIMDRLWLDNGLDLRMKPYKVISTWDHTGIIEMVPNSTTISDIHSQFGGATGALDKETIIKYLEKHNTTQASLEAAQQNFLRSCAGYCVATFIMGVGDRHNGNIMVAQTGHFFHIDFGHFLGNFKSKFGFKRERTYFVFSREMQHAITYNAPGNFETFQELCCEAYQTIRTQGNVLIEMFLMMLSAGMPELTQKSDIDYLRDRMEFTLTQQEAMAMFKEEIQRSLQDIFRVFDNQIHNMKHQTAPQKQSHTHLDSIDIQL